MRIKNGFILKEVADRELSKAFILRGRNEEEDKRYLNSVENAIRIRTSEEGSVAL